MRTRKLHALYNGLQLLTVLHLQLTDCNNLVQCIVTFTIQQQHVRHQGNFNNCCVIMDINYSINTLNYMAPEGTYVI